MSDERGGELSGDLERRLVAAEAEVERLRAKVDSVETVSSALGARDLELAAARAELDSLRSGRLVQVLIRLRRVGRRLRLAPAPTPPISLEAPSRAYPTDIRYPTWVATYDTVDDGVRENLRAQLAGLADPPLISIVMPVFNTPEPFLRAAIESVTGQLYKRWELCIADDASTAAWVPKVLAEYAASDERIKTVTRRVNGHICASSNSALELATGPWVALLDHDDLLAEHALALVALSIAGHPKAALLYSDEDHIDERDVRSTPYFKGDFDPLLLLGQNYISHLSVIRRDLIEAVGAYREGYEGSQDWDLVLRISERVDPAQIVHIPHVLYHWRTHAESTASSLFAKPYAATAAVRAVSDHLSRRGQGATVASIGTSGFNRVHWALPEEPPTVSVVVLPRKGIKLMRCLDSVTNRSTYSNIELVVVDDGGRQPPLREFLHYRWEGLTVVRVDEDCSDGALRNAGARRAAGEVICFLHDDIEVTTDGWLEEMVGLLLQPNVGAVGSKLLYLDGDVQHAGIVLGIGNTIGHVHRGTDRLEPGYFGRAMLTQRFSAVSWACMAVRREAFDAVGGFAQDQFSDAFADVDFCLRLPEAGWSVGWTPHAELLHAERRDEPRESEGENAVRFAREIRHLRKRWGAVMDADPHYNPNLTLAHENFALAWPPRTDITSP